MLRRIADLSNKSSRNYCAVYSDFLTPAQQALIASVNEFYGLVSFTGGYEDAERRVCRVSCSEYDSDRGAPIVLFSVNAASKDAVLGHRDVLGSLMGLGIKRGMIGDILPNGRSPQFFCLEQSAEFIEFNLKKIGHHNVTLTRSDTALILPPEYSEFSINVSSMRLDCICAECFGISRTKAADQIKHGSVSLNWLAVTDPSHEVKPADKISLLGRGKIEISEITGTSKKGRLFVKVRKRI